MLGMIRVMAFDLMPNKIVAITAIIAFFGLFGIDNLLSSRSFCLDHDVKLTRSRFI